MDFNTIARKWQSRWEKAKLFEVKEDSKKKKSYVLQMFPYPSGASLHMGHVKNYVTGDIVARHKRMLGFNVLQPFGYDAFGLPAENAAIKSKSHPKIFTETAIQGYTKQAKALGLSYDWSRVLSTCYPDYYKWNQWFFVKFFERGLTYKKKAPVNWCQSCQTVLANEQVEQGKCWRCHNEVSIKQLEQWFFKITDYAEQLLKDLSLLAGWPERIRTMQSHWIGKSEGATIYFPIKDSKEKIEVFTTRPDTLFGVNCIIFAPEHPQVLELVKGTSYQGQVHEFINKVVIKERFKRGDEDQEKEGVFIGKYAINPLTKEELPIYVANFILLEYGTGAIMSVPAHDQRDFEFAKKYQLPIKVVIQPQDKKIKEPLQQAFTGEGSLVNSGSFNGVTTDKAKGTIIKELQAKKIGKAIHNYKLRDWLVSRQRYWGTPIPIIYCTKCGIVPVPEKDLPVVLPDKVEFTGEGNPLAKVKDFVHVNCPTCKAPAKRETDTMDTFVDSSWYFLRFCDANNKNAPFDTEKVKYWMPVNQYTGGAEHAVMHLLYARFFTKALRDMKLLDVDEPFVNLFNQGMLHKDGVVMSKSKGNIIAADEISQKYGIDTARWYLMSVASPDKDIEWDDKAVEGSFRALNKIVNLVETAKYTAKDERIMSKMHETIRDVTQTLESMTYNISLIRIMDYVSYLMKRPAVTKESIEVLIKLIAPIVPHMAEELWEITKHKGFISVEPWPKFDEKKINPKVDAAETIVENTAADIQAVLNLVKMTPKEITLFVAEKWKYPLFKKLHQEESRDFGLLMKKFADKEHGQDVAKLVQHFMKGALKTDVVLAPEEELDALKESKSLWEKQFAAKVHVMHADTSKEQKAKQALPGKVAILIK